MSFNQYIYDYYEIPAEFDTFHSVHLKKQSEEEEIQIENQIKQHFEDQEANLNAKRKQIFTKIKNQNYPYRKKFICSPWVRGFCFFQTKDCIHAHGTEDLVYLKDDNESKAQNNYERIDMKELTNSLNYLYLYQFCQKYELPDKKQITLEEINNDRTIRTSIREYTRTKLFEDFYLLLRRTYPDILLTEQFLVAEFTRIGVGSDALGFNIKSGRISAYLMKHMCYLAKCYHPPSICQYSNYIMIRDKRLQIQQYFKEKLLQVLWELKKQRCPFIESPIIQLVKESQKSELEPNFEVYLIKDNMCLFRYFKSWANQDEDFLKQCTQIFETTEENAEIVLKNILFDCCSDQSEKIIRKNKLIEEYLSMKYKNQKKKFCRYWLRGLCIFDRDQCQYSHGADDLVYKAYDEYIDDQEYTDFMNQKPLWKERSYVSLFREQNTLLRKGLIDKISTQIELDDKKDLRESVREKMQVNAMEEFMETIWKYYGKDIIFTESFIVREFTRVGFFKIGYTLKNQIIIDIIVQRKCFMSTTILPPLLQKRVLLYSYPDYPVIVKHFIPKVIKVFLTSKEEIKANTEEKQSNILESANKNQENNDEDVDDNEGEQIKEIEQNKSSESDEVETSKILKQEECDEQNEPLFTVNEYIIRKEFYKEQQADVPPLHSILKYYGKQLQDVIHDIFNDEEFKTFLTINIPQFDLKTLKNSLLLDSDQDKLQKLTNEVLVKKSEKVMFNLNKLFFKIYGVFRPQIRATIGMARFKDNFKALLVEKYNCDIFNMNCKTLVLQKKVLKNLIKKNSTQKHLNNTSKQDNQYRDSILSGKYIFKEAKIPIRDRIITIETQQDIEKALLILQQQSLLGVDLEGHLSKNGHIELIQMSYFDYKNNHSIIYVFDFLTIEKQSELFKCGKNAIKSIMEDKSIIKILQGCQKDALALYHLFNTQIIHGIDTQIAHNFISQICVLANSKPNAKKFIQDQQYYNCGLNSILQLYSAPNGLNPLKNKFQAIFVDSEQSFFYMQTRPINEEFLIYSCKDVEDLIPVYFNILISSISSLKLLYDGIDITSAIHLLLRISEVTSIYKPK